MSKCFQKRVVIYLLPFVNIHLDRLKLNDWRTSLLSKIDGNRPFGTGKLLILHDALPYQEIRLSWAAGAVQKPRDLQVTGPYKGKANQSHIIGVLGEAPMCRV